MRTGKRRPPGGSVDKGRMSTVARSGRFGHALSHSEPVVRAVPIVGPGGREIPMTLPKLNIPPAYEDDDER
jgi:hypothetical protein